MELNRLDGSSASLGAAAMLAEHGGVAAESAAAARHRLEGGDICASTK